MLNIAAPLFRYAEFGVFRTRVAAENTFTAVDTREQLAYRNFSCFYEQCPQCNQECTKKWLESLISVWRCTIGNDWFGISSCQFQSDAGQRIYAMHGAVREKRLKGNVSVCFDQYF